MDLKGPEAKALIEECREAFGRPPRELDEKARTKALWMPVWFGDRKLRSIIRDSEKLLREGRVVWGHLVEANELLFEEGSENLPALAVYSLSPEADERPDLLRKTAAAIFALKGQRPKDPELKKIARKVTNEIARFSKMPVPASLAELPETYMSVIWVTRSHLPDGKLSAPLAPFLTEAPGSDSLMILPSRYWPGALSEQWDRPSPEEEAWERFTEASRERPSTSEDIETLFREARGTALEVKLALGLQSHTSANDLKRLALKNAAEACLFASVAGLAAAEAINPWGLAFGWLAFVWHALALPVGAARRASRRLRDELENAQRDNFHERWLTIENVPKPLYFYYVNAIFYPYWKGYKAAMAVSVWSSMIAGIGLSCGILYYHEALNQEFKMSLIGFCFLYPLATLSLSLVVARILLGFAAGAKSGLGRDSSWLFHPPETAIGLDRDWDELWNNDPSIPILICAKNTILDLLRTIFAAFIFVLVIFGVTSLCSMVGLLFYNGLSQSYLGLAKAVWGAFSILGFFASSALAAKVVSRLFPVDWARLRRLAPKR